jgi:DNA-binding Lrp family transcriptional regulator
MSTQTELRFDGPDLEPEDIERLGKQMGAVLKLMRDGQWRTLAEISAIVKCSEPSASARLRDFRKTRFGGYTVNRRRTAVAGMFEYQVVTNG